MHDSPWAGSIALCGLALVVSLGFTPSGPAVPASWFHRLIDVAMIGGSGVVLVYVGYWHAGRSLLADRYPHIVAWTATTTLVFVSVAVVSLYIGSRGIQPAELFESVHLAGSVGVAMGLLAGTVHARALDNAEAVASARARAEALDAQRDREKQFNDLLRHYILNGVNVISGYATQLRSTVPPGDQSPIDVVDRRARSMATLVEHVDSILRATSDPTTRTDVDLGAAIASATGGIDRRSRVEIGTVDCDRAVRAAETLDEALHLLFDAVASVTEPGGEIAVACDGTGGTVTVAITAAPADLSEPIAASLFEPIADTGLQFYLARRLVDGYGELRLAERSDDALRFELVLEAA